METVSSSSGTEQQRKWKVWAVADKLEELEREFCPAVTPKVVSLLRELGSKFEYVPSWMSLLDKKSLLHEMEESIVAIDHLLKGTEGINKKYIAVDVCAGKGLFSFVLSYLKPANIKRIVLLEKASINWVHIEAANETAEEEGRPHIDIWSNTNLHDYDYVLERLISLPHPVAMTGIHLCKLLSPSFCGLVNGLGKEKCLYACLAPCCLPRVVTMQKKKKKRDSTSSTFTISIQLEESEEQRKSRQDYMRRRSRKKRKPSGGPCFHCHDEKHGTTECPILATLPDDERIAVLQAEHISIVPCFNCLQYGHFKIACPVPMTRANPPPKTPPMLPLNVSNVLNTERPFSTYCHLLAGSLQNRELSIKEADLKNSDKQHQDGNWNSERKSIFIVAT